MYSIFFRSMAVHFGLRGSPPAVIAQEFAHCLISAATAPDIRHSGFVPWAPHEIATAVPMATRWSITTVGQGARSAPWLLWWGCGSRIVSGSSRWSQPDLRWSSRRGRGCVPAP